MLLLMRHCIDSGHVDYQKDFLESIGFSPTNLKFVRSGKRSFTLEHIVTAAKKYKVNINWICGLEDNMKRNKNGSALQNLKDSVREIEAKIT